jgi:molecular chaperone DnaK
VTFDIDANGMVHVSAVEKTSGRKQEVTVEPSGGLSEGDIQRMVHEAEGAEGSDRERRKLVEARNRLDGVVIAALRGMRDEPEGPAELRQTLDLAVDRAQAALRQEGTPPDEVQGSYEALAQALAAYLDAARKAREAQEAPKPSEEGGEPTREGAEEM